MQNLNLVENLSMALSVFYMQVWFIYVIFFLFLVHFQLTFMDGAKAAFAENGS